MMKFKNFIATLNVAFCLAAPAAYAQALQKDQPIEISSDKLDVFQDQNKAIFSGNVIAIQGTTNLRSGTMTVFYRGGGAKKGEEAAPSGAPQGIYRIEAQTGVVFTTPTDTAMGDRAIYNVDEETIDLTGSSVTLTQGQNILKGTHVVHNMATGRSIMTSGATAVSGGATGGKAQRVHGLFIPKSGDEKKK